MKDEFGGDVIEAAKPQKDEFGSPIIQHAPTAAEIEEMRPKNLIEQGWTGLKNLAAGIVKSPASLVGGAAGLLAKLQDKAGVTQGQESWVKQGVDSYNAGVDKTLRAGQPGYEIAQFTGETVPQMLVPYEKAVPAISGALQALKLPPHLANFAGRTAVNTGLGAAQGESEGHPVAGAVAGAVGSGLAELAKAAGGQIIKSYIKGGHRGAAEGLDVPWFLGKEMGGSPAKMATNVDNELGRLRSIQDAVIAQKGNLPTPVLQALQNVENKINSPDFAAANLGSLPAAKAQLQDYVDDFLPIANPQTGEAPLAHAWEIKKKAGSDAATLYRNMRSGNGSVRDMTKQGVSAMVATEMSNLIEKTAPEMTNLNPEFAKLIPVAKALERRGRIAGQHNPIGLDELAAIESGVNFMVHGHIGGMGLPLIQKASKSPAFGQLMRNAGNKSSRMTALIPPAIRAADFLSAGTQE